MGDYDHIQDIEELRHMVSVALFKVEQVGSLPSVGDGIGSACLVGFAMGMTRGPRYCFMSDDFN